MGKQQSGLQAWLVDSSGAQPVGCLVERCLDVGRC
jgi:hypothetical protein